MALQGWWAAEGTVQMPWLEEKCRNTLCEDHLNGFGCGFFFPLDIPIVTPFLLNLFSKFLTTQKHDTEFKHKS